MQTHFGYNIHFEKNKYLGNLWINSLAPGKFQWNFKHIIFKQILVIHAWGIFY